VLVHYGSVGTAAVERKRERECNFLEHHRRSQTCENLTRNLSVHRSITERNYIIRQEDNNHAVSQGQSQS